MDYYEYASIGLPLFSDEDKRKLLIASTPSGNDPTYFKDRWSSPPTPIKYSINKEQVAYYLQTVNSTLFKNSLIPIVHTFMSVMFNLVKERDTYNSLFSRGKGIYYAPYNFRGAHAQSNIERLFTTLDSFDTGWESKQWDSVKWGPTPPLPHHFGARYRLEQTVKAKLLHYDVVKTLCKEGISSEEIEILKDIVKGTRSAGLALKETKAIIILTIGR